MYFTSLSNSTAKTSPSPVLRPSMGLLGKLWDETLAGPRPDSALGRLRKPSALRSSAMDGSASAGERRGNTAADGSAEETPRVTSSIMIKRPSGSASPWTGATPPSSPAGSTPPVSPFAVDSVGAAGKEWNQFSRRSIYGKGGEAVGGDSGEASIYSYPPFEV